MLSVHSAGPTLDALTIQTFLSVESIFGSSPKISCVSVSPSSLMVYLHSQPRNHERRGGDPTIGQLSSEITRHTDMVAP